ncbi:MAG: hypothetical protein KatS3mg019_1219 [Fimbriimonadales bacterium]|nr:MAG: hypothetical protein KatS3mg019_1219 [Fimbriimonadales bacterium]
MQKVIWTGLIVALALLIALCFSPAYRPYTLWKMQAMLTLGGRTHATFYDILGNEADEIKLFLSLRERQIEPLVRNDFYLAWGRALFQGGAETAQVRQSLMQLRRQFPKRAEVYASLLRNEMRGFRIGRKEEARFSRDGAPPSPSDPQQAQRVLEWAQTGEQLDPENAFFTGMRVRALLALQRDSEAIRALKQAAQKPRWDDYVSAEAEAQIRYWRLLQNKRSGEVDIALTMGMLFPHLAAERSNARVLTALAQDLEAQGRFRDALEIRIALTQYAQKMMREQKTTIHSLVGIAIAQIAVSSPPTASHLSLQQRQEGFLKRLQQAGFPNEVAWFRAEFNRMDAIRLQIRKAFDKFYDDHLIPFLYRYYWQLLALFGLQGLSLALGAQWAALWWARRASKGFAFTITLLIMAWLGATLWFTFSESGALMGKTIESITAAETLMSSTSGAALPSIFNAPLPIHAILRWVLPIGATIWTLVLIGIVFAVALFRRPNSPEAIRQALHNAIGVFLVVALLGLSSVLFLSMRTDQQLERITEAIRRGEVETLLRATGAPPQLPPPTPLPR